MIFPFKRLTRPRLPVIYQTSTTECGLACLAMVSAFHGLDIDIQSIRNRFEVSLRGMTLQDLDRVASDLKFETSGLRVKSTALEKLRLPAVLHWNNNHFVVLKEVGHDGIVIHDPALGSTNVSYEELDDHFNGVVLTLKPAADFVVGQQHSRITIAELLSGVQGVKSVLVKIVMISFLLELFINLTPLYMQYLVDEVLPNNNTDLLSLIFVGFILVVIFQAITSILRSWFMLRMGVSINKHIQSKTFTHLVKLPINYFEQRHTGDIMSRFGAMNTIQHTVTAGLVRSFIDAVMGIIVLIIMFAYSPLLSFVVLAFLGFYGIIRWWYYRPFKVATAESLITKASLDTHFLETIRGIRGVKVFNRQAMRNAQWQQRLDRTFDKEMRMHYLQINFLELGALSNNIERGVVLFLGAHLVMSGQFSVGYLLAFLAYKEQFVQRVNSLVSYAIDFAMLRLHIERLSDITSTEPEADPIAEPVVSDAIPLEANMSLDGIGFRYSPYEDWVIKDFSCHINAGEHVVITGRSGVGKSTIVKLMLKMAEPEEGVIKVGGIPIGALGDVYNSMVSAVLQDDSLYSGSLLDNITFSDSKPDIAWAQECAEVANIHNDILAMKMKYHTLIGDLGTALSGGQKQRILLARALYARPQILIMDEATSDLDVSLEKDIIERLKGLNITRISVSHRTQTIASADRQILL